jgi:hypothetical protein
MAEISKAAFARLAGVSKPAIAKAIKSGNLILLPSKKIDDQDKLSIAYLKKQKSKGKTSPPEKKKAPDKKQTTPKQEIKPVKENVKQILPPPENLPQSPQLNLSEISLDQADKHDLEKMKLKEQIVKERIKNDKERGDLIHRDFVKKFFLELYNIDQNQFLQLEHSLSNKICDFFKTTKDKDIIKVNEILHDGLYKTQNHIKIKIDKFLESMEKYIK